MLAKCQSTFRAVVSNNVELSARISTNVHWIESARTSNARPSQLLRVAAPQLGCLGGRDATLVSPLPPVKAWQEVGASPVLKRSTSGR